MLSMKGMNKRALMWVPNLDVTIITTRYELVA